MTAPKVGALALDYMTDMHQWGSSAIRYPSAYDDVRALMARCEALEAEVDHWKRAAANEVVRSMGIAAERDAARADAEALAAALEEIDGDLTGRCEPGSTALHCLNVARRALSAHRARREGGAL